MLALLYDIHGNLPALEAAVADAHDAGARRFLLGGDYALFGPWPRETVERLRDLDADRIRGNGERWTADPDSAPDVELVQRAISTCAERLGPETVRELAALPETIERDSTLYCHGSPLSDVRSFFPDPVGDERELIAGAPAGRLVFGHTHLQFRRRAQDGPELVNPGSVGMPFDGDVRAAYALVGPGGEVELRRVRYDHEASAAAVRDRFGPWAETVARRIELGAFEV